MSAFRTKKPPVSSQTQAAFFFARSLFTLLKVRPNELIEREPPDNNFLHRLYPP